jgi:peptidoglycan/LPS O-acetylase OafA/YrhL
MTLRIRHTPVPLIDWAKAIASQLIVWHHLTIYGPMRRAVDPLAPDLFAWLADPARLAVQVFLVMSGFLAARSLMPTPGRSGAIDPAAWPALLWQRCQRLVPPYLLALLSALLSAWVARTLMDDADTPAVPTWTQFFANALLLQDIVGQDALSAGVWYVAIDLQLFALLATLAALLGATRLRDASLTVAAVVLIAGSVAASLLWLNRMSDADMWAPYFFGAYGLGVLAHWVVQAPGRAQRLAGLSLMTALVFVALWLDWRSRIALAGVVALALAFNLGSGWLGRTRVQPLVAHLSRISYGVFLTHYPISLLVAAGVTWLAPDSLELNLLGLIGTWLASLMAGQALQRWAEPSSSASIARGAAYPARS